MPIDRSAKAAGAYLRISKDALKLGLGVDRQDELCRQVASARGWTVRRVYRDNDISASLQAPRPGYEELCADVAEGRVDGIIAVDQDRLTRHPRELEDLIDLADAAGIPIALSSGELDLTSSDDRLRARMLGAVAKQESEKKSERIRRQKDWARRHGRWVGQAPFGYRTVDAPDGRGRVLEVAPAEAVVVVELARRVLDGETLYAAAQWASTLGVTTRGGRAAWSPMTVRRTLTHPAMAGWQPHQRDLYRHPETGQLVRVCEEPVLDQVTWQRLRRVFAGRKRTGTSGRAAQILLARLVVCAECGHTMSYSAGGTHGNARYVCRTSSERSGDCPGNTATAHHVDRLVDLWAASWLDDLFDAGGTARVAVDVNHDLAREVDHLTGLLTAQEAERRQLLLAGASPERVAAVTETLDIIDDKLTAARGRLDRRTRTVDLAAVRAQLPGAQPAEAYTILEVPDRRRILTHLVDRVHVSSARGVGRRGRFDAGRVDIVPAGT